MYPKTTNTVTTVMMPISAIGTSATRRTNQTLAEMRGCTVKAGPPANCASWATHSRATSNGLVVNAMVRQVDGHAAQEAARGMINDARQVDKVETTLIQRADIGCDSKEFIEALQQMNVLPPVAQNKSVRKSAVPEAVAGSEGYENSPEKRKRIELSFGWAKMVGHMMQVLVRGLWKGHRMFVVTMTVYNLISLRTLGRCA